MDTNDQRIIAKARQDARECDCRGCLASDWLPTDRREELADIADGTSSAA
ncbi:hypothetical protein I8D64_01715 [Brachybacterium sp. MASK1Z-5]|uniref:Uncharacterized protein n=1 Tax=Brachybacterium halotolerans TaxID=2795215 RepID=A0ABS1B681_9MICO|nr:hypothetical protein [Brachybacterium halotolerans]MBK0330120.1 hypothetical protein [Brachybacterium halotolerans]